MVGQWDRIRIEQLVTNLVANALKYGRGKPVLVTVERGTATRPCCTIRDQGIGIDPDKLPRIFERFERAASPTYGGLGLGLYIARQIVTAHGGEIRVTSEPDRGRGVHGGAAPGWSASVSQAASAGSGVPLSARALTSAARAATACIRAARDHDAVMDGERSAGGVLAAPGRGHAAPATIIRDQTIARLSDAFATDLIDVEEFERRVTVAQRSDSLAEIQSLVADLPARPNRPRRPGAGPADPVGAAAARAVKQRGTVFTIMGGVERKGSWTVPRSLNVGVVMGGAKLDLREAWLPPGPIELRVAALMGGVEIIVPPHLPVEAEGIAIMGGFDHVDRAPAEPDPGAPLLRVTGLAFMGGVHIEMRLPGESSRDARKRRKRERRALERAR